MHGGARYAEASRNLRFLHALTGEFFDLAPLLRCEHWTTLLRLLPRVGIAVAMRRIFSRVCADCAACLHRVSVRSPTNGTPARRIWNGFGADVQRPNPSVIGCHPPAPDWNVHHSRTPGPAESPAEGGRSADVPRGGSIIRARVSTR